MATNFTVRNLSHRAEWVEHKAFMDDFFFVTNVFDDIERQEIICMQESATELTRKITWLQTEKT